MNNILDNQLFEAFANASDMTYIYVTDMNTDLSRWSRGAVEYFGLDDEYMYDAKSLWLDHIHPDDRQIYLDDINAVFSGKSEHHNCQYRARSKTGDYVWVECKGSLIKNDEGVPTVFAGMMTRIDHQSKYDSLTHLLTGYELFRTPITESGAMMLIGVDRFREINSRYGLLYGNKVLLYLSELLSSSAKDDIIYRFRGDEFAIYGRGKSIEDMEKLFDDLYRTCHKGNSVKEIKSFSISGGIVEFDVDEDTTEILGQAELSITYAKEHSSKVAVYSSAIESLHIRKKKVAEALNKCISNNFEGFRLVYQPIVSSTGDCIIGCESLLRWNPNDEDLGASYPDEFIPILESNGGINEVGYFVMRESIRQAAEWQKKYKKFNVSFNVSYLQLEDPKFVPAIVETVEKYDMDPTSVIVELTESVLAVDTSMVRASFELLKKHGLKIALDDFGTGNSSFLTLHNINIDIVKLDQSFIRGLDANETGIDHAIIESVGLMCNRIGCMTVAEGVETEVIWGMIKQYGFTGLQGYLFSRPVEVEDFEKVLQKYGMKK